MDRQIVNIALQGLGPRARKIALYFFEHPEATQKEIAEHFGIVQQRVSTVLNSNRFIKALRSTAQRGFHHSIPLAMKELRKCLIQNKDYRVKRQTARDILEETSTIGPQKVQVQVSHLEQASPEELQAMIQEAAKVQAPIIDAEIVRDEEDSERSE